MTLCPGLHSVLAITLCEPLQVAANRCRANLTAWAGHRLVASWKVSFRAIYISGCFLKIQGSAWDHRVVTIFIVYSSFVTNMSFDISKIDISSVFEIWIWDGSQDRHVVLCPRSSFPSSSPTCSRAPASSTPSNSTWCAFKQKILNNLPFWLKTLTILRNWPPVMCCSPWKVRFLCKQHVVCGHCPTPSFLDPRGFVVNNPVFFFRREGSLSELSSVCHEI